MLLSTRRSAAAALAAARTVAASTTVSAAPWADTMIAHMGCVQLMRHRLPRGLPGYNPRVVGVLLLNGAAGACGCRMALRVVAAKRLADRLRAPLDP